MPPGVLPYYQPPIDPLGPAKRASLLMFIMGPLIFLAGACLVSVPSMLRVMPPNPQLTQTMQQLDEELHGDVDAKLMIGGVFSAVVGVAMLILAFFVRRGGRTACILGAVLAGLLGVWSVMNLLGGLLMGNVGGVCMSALMIASFGLMIAWLIQAIRASGRVTLAQQQYAAQYWQYQQTMQAYANAGYGYGVPPQGQVPVAPAAFQPPPPPPTAQPNPENPPSQ
jgi:hypothetical protein